jgi:GNAT superfamily N-acetyltransferase
MLIDGTRVRLEHRTSTTARGRQTTRDVTVRVATARDVATVAALRLALVTATGRPPRGSPRLAQRARRLTAAHIGREGDVTFLAVARGRVIGMVRAVEVRGAALAGPARYAVLTSAYVRPGFRRRGALRALVSAADAWCQSRRLGELRLHCAAGNDGGNAAWSALGFAAADVRYRRGVQAR